MPSDRIAIQRLFGIWVEISPGLYLPETQMLEDFLYYLVFLDDAYHSHPALALGTC